MEQTTASPHATAWDRLDTAVRPTATTTEPPRSGAAERIEDAAANVSERLQAPAFAERMCGAGAVGRALQQAGAYFKSHRPEEIRGDVERLIVKRPIVSVCLAVVVGYVAGRAVWR